jgi:GntR family transcriptional repressor for pyruvate dehydrogenase complex
VALQVEPVQRRLVSEAVFDALLADVLAGRLAPGDGLPGERALSESFAVNRHAVREALKRLQQAGLVQVAQGGATRVTDWRRTAGLDLLTSLAAAGPGPELVRAIVEMRVAVGADVARLCAERTPDAPGIEPDATEDGYIAFWEAIADGADNLAYRLALNTLVSAQRTGALDPGLYVAEREDLAAQHDLAVAIAAGEGALAHRRATELLGRALP